MLARFYIRRRPTGVFPRKRLRLRCATTASSTTELRKATIGRATGLSFSNYLSLSPSLLSSLPPSFLLSRVPTVPSFPLLRSLVRLLPSATQHRYPFSFTGMTRRDPTTRSSTIINAFVNVSLHRARRINDHLSSGRAPYADACVCVRCVLCMRRAHVSKTSVPLLVSRETGNAEERT